MWKDNFKFRFSHFPKENLIIWFDLFCFCVLFRSFPLQINASFLSCKQFFTQKENFSARAEFFPWEWSCLLLSSGSCSRANDKPRLRILSLHNLPDKHLDEQQENLKGCKRFRLSDPLTLQRDKFRIVLAGLILELYYSGRLQGEVTG